MTSPEAARFHGRIVTGVLAVAQNPYGHVLFVHQPRGPYAGHWILPGGGIEPGEAAADAVVREIHEEAGLRLSDPAYLACYELVGEWAGGRYHLILLAFTAQTYQAIPAEFAGDRPGAAEFRDVRRAPLHPTDMQILTDAGIVTYSRSTINRALGEAGIWMQRYGEPPRP